MEIHATLYLTLYSAGTKYLSGKKKKKKYIYIYIYTYIATALYPRPCGEQMLRDIPLA